MWVRCHVSCVQIYVSFVFIIFSGHLCHIFSPAVGWWFEINPGRLHPGFSGMSSSLSLVSSHVCVCVWNRDPNSNGTPLPWSYPHNLHNSKWPQVCVVLEPIAGHGLPIHTCRIASIWPLWRDPQLRKKNAVTLQRSRSFQYKWLLKMATTNSQELDLPPRAKTSGIPT